MDLATALGPNHGDDRVWCIAQLLSVNTTTNRASVSIDGGPAVALPYIPGTYTGITTVFVLRDPVNGPMVIGPCGTQTAIATPPPPPPPPAPTDPAIVTSRALIRPVWSGTYRNSRSTYDRWNTDRYGGRSTVYQGDAFGSGTLVGIAVYGSQVQALGALSISSIIVSTPIATGSGGIDLRGTAQGSKPAGAPTPAGTTNSGTTTVALDATTRDAMRTGSVKGLVSTGTSYRGTRGTSLANGMSLTVVYTRPA